VKEKTPSEIVSEWSNKKPGSQRYAIIFENTDIPELLENSIKQTGA